MKEIGGYIELDTFNLPMLHESAVALNCGRNALAYIIKSRKISSIVIPYFLCSSVKSVCKRCDVSVRHYHINKNFVPDEKISLGENEWLYVVNYYDTLTDEEIGEIISRHKNVILDYAHSYFRMPVQTVVDTLYTCRKYFGVSDGAFLYTDCKYADDLEQDESYSRMRFLLGRYERSASEFYSEYKANNDLFENEPIKKMSKLTSNLLHAIDYKAVESRRLENFAHLHARLGHLNQLKLKFNGTFMYPLMIENGAEVRKELQKKKIYIPILWPDVFDTTQPSDLEYQMAKNILPLPIDQRYCASDMENIIEAVIDSANYVAKET